MRRLLAASAVFVVAALLSSIPVGRAQSAVSDDINRDGAADLIVGVALEDVSGNRAAGTVNVIYSDGDMLTADGNVSLTQAGPIKGRVEPDDLFGSAVELADINGDGYADAIIGASGETIGLGINAGNFHVILGSADGLDLATATAYSQGGDLPGRSELGDFFGYNITSGDFDDDGYDDVVVSAPFEDIGTRIRAGGFVVVPGSAAGLDTARAAFHSQAGPVAGAVEAGDLLGWSLATGDFNDDGYDDLAAGAPGEDYGDIADSGAVNVLYGSSDGLTVVGDIAFSQAGSIRNSPENGDLFGWSVAASDLNCDSIDDLLIGVPNEAFGSGGDRVVAGIVHVLLGSEKGLRRSANTRLAQGFGGVAGERDFNQFGAAMAGGDFDGDGCGDVAISAHTTDVGGTGAALCVEDPGCEAEAGSVVVVYGSDDWPTIGGTANFSQRGPTHGVAEADDFFGRTLAALDIDGDGIDDLAVGAPREDIGSLEDAGGVTILRGTDAGLVARGSYGVSQAGAYAGRVEAGDRFGSALADAISSTVG